MLMLDGVVNVFSLSLAFALIGLNVYLSTQVLNVTDLTCDASVALGGCAYGALVVYGTNPFVAFLLATCLGAMAGFITSSLVGHVSIEPVLASIITLTALQTFITKLSDTGNAIAHKGLVFSPSAICNFTIVMAAVLIIGVLFFKMLNSEYGLAMRVYGDGKIISESLGINTNQILWIGLGIGNALSAIAGALITQVTGGFNSGMGGGSLVFGLASVIIGEKILAPKSVKAAIGGCFIGAFVYKIMIEIVTFSGSTYNGAIMAVVLILLMLLIQEDNKKRRKH
jgi:putative ABC transport system permease protein